MNSDFDNYILDGIDDNGNIQEEVFALLFNTFYHCYLILFIKVILIS